MRLIKLEMYGFKSFARKTEIQFEDGITAIIGPNGSGKSNIADAVRWVLGEQSAKALRGSKMEDIIFNGTEARKALAYCEVSLTFDNTDHELFTDFAEVAITRRMYRSGESEFFINRQACRRKDIAELFRDTGVGRDGYSIIGQGKVEEILSNKSADRRNAFEEAAGVMKYRVRKEEAERKLDNTRTNLERLRDILDELIKQVGPLEEQSTAARAYLKLRDELREIEINVFLYQYDKLNEKLKTLAESIAQLAEETARREALDGQLAEACNAEEESERALNGTISEMQSKLLAMTTGVETRTGESKVFRERLQNLMRERERAEAERSDAETKLAAMNADIKAREGAAEEKRAENERAQTGLAEAGETLEAMKRESETREIELETQKNEMIAALNRLADAKILMSRFETMRSAMEKQIESIEKGRAGALKKHDELCAEYNDALAVQKKLEGERDGLDDARKAAINNLNETNQRLREAREEVRNAEQHSEAGRARLKVLEEMKRAHEGYYASVRNLLRDAERDTQLKHRIEGVVAELIRVPSEYETAIEMAIGPALQNIVTASEEDAKSVIEYLRRREYGRATFLPISAMRPRLLDARERGMCRVDGFVGVASELISFDERYRGIAENLLGRTVIVRDLDAGIAINRQAHSSFRIATLKGDIINPGGSMTGGSTQKREFSLVGREREIDDLRRRNAELDALREAKSREAEELEAGLDGANDAVAECAKHLHEKELELATQAEKTDIIKKYVDEADEALAEAEGEIERIRDDIDNIDGQFKNAQQDSTAIEQGRVATQDDIKTAQESLAKLRIDVAAQTERVSDMRVAAATAVRELASMTAELERLRRECAQLRAADGENAKKLVEYKTQFDALTGEMSTIEGSIESERRDVDELTDRLHAAEEERVKHLRSLDELRERRDAASDELAALRDRSHRTELNISRAEMELKSIQDRIWEDYELTRENAEPYRRDIALTASHVRIDELKRAIKELGDVNLNSIEDYKSVKERYDGLSVQYDDLIKAEADLHKLIEELVSTMENEFRRQFTRIQENFSATFAELFGGGSAELVLSDKNDILNCNIEIIAQPPGKKLQLLSLLSGGERALTAIALLFAILKLKPTAFCILDEIESSLDEVNVSTVAQYVKHYSADTQFILITHRKGSMEVCNALYGVAMEEKGVSKVVSAKFSA